MRVIGGEFRSRPLKSLPGLDVRPTPDRLREALFNVIATRLGGVIFADLYAGTGAVGIEALSRGAARAVLVEQNRAAVGVIRENLKSLDLTSRADVWVSRVRSALVKLRANIVFLDPPYALEREYGASLQMLGGERMEASPELAIVQHDVRLVLAPSYGCLHQTRELRQSDNILTFYESRIAADL